MEHRGRGKRNCLLSCDSYSLLCSQCLLAWPEDEGGMVVGGGPLFKALCARGVARKHFLWGSVKEPAGFTSLHFFPFSLAPSRISTWISLPAAWALRLAPSPRNAYMCFTQEFQGALEGKVKVERNEKRRGRTRVFTVSLFRCFLVTRGRTGEVGFVSATIASPSGPLRPTAHPSASLHSLSI